MYPIDGDDVCDSLGPLISHLEAIWCVNHQQQQPPHPHRHPHRHPAVLAASSLTCFHCSTPGAEGSQRIECSRLRKEEEEGEQVKGKQCCWRTRGWGPGEADQIGALEISHVGALWRPNG